jgi:hypothetical protein
MAEEVSGKLPQSDRNGYAYRILTMVVIMMIE